ncbi:MAG: hypothetical protein ABR607_10550 [Pyrinomonadaceae bacterium]
MDTETIEMRLKINYRVAPVPSYVLTVACFKGRTVGGDYDLRDLGQTTIFMRSARTIGSAGLSRH